MSTPLRLGNGVDIFAQEILKKYLERRPLYFEKERPGGPEFWCLRTGRCSVAAASVSALGCERLELQISRVSVDAASLPHQWMSYFSLLILARGTPRLLGGLCHQLAGWRRAGCASLDACCARRHSRGTRRIHIYILYGWLTRAVPAAESPARG